MKPTTLATATKPDRLLAVCLLGGVLLLFFWRSLVPGLVHFSNDGPLGQVSAAWSRVPQAFTGCWGDLNSLGFAGGAAPMSVTSFLRWALGPVGYAKFLVPVTLLCLGLCAWFCFRQMKLGPAAALLGGLAAMLDSVFFSSACWGVAPQEVCIGANFLALAAIVSRPPRWAWLKYVLAGFAVGVGVMEGADIGALFSLGMAAFVVYQALMDGEGGPFLRRAVAAIGRTALVAVFAAFIAVQTISSLVSTSIKGMAGTGQDTQSKQEHWDWATQWSLPKREAWSLIVPGLFGYGMATPQGMAVFGDSFDGGNYWGAMGQDVAWDKYFATGRQGPPPRGFLRHTGGGNYPGLLVVLVALWAALQAFRKKDSVFSLAQRKMVWFWAGASVLSLLLAFGRHAPFYRLLYALPYFSTIRNPTKFLLILDFSLVVLFAYGVHGLWRKYMEAPASVAANLTTRLRNWWAKTSPFDKRWVSGCALTLAASLVAWLVYASSRRSLEQYLQNVQFDEALARKIAAFSIGSVFWFELFFVLSSGLLLLIFSGVFAGARARLGAILLGSVLVLDLGHANLPWVMYWDYEQKYASNPVIDFLRQKPYEHRAALLPSWIPMAFRVPEQITAAEAYLDQLYNIEWVQQLFPYYNIQSLDIVQMPRMPEDLAAFEGALQFHSAQDVTYLVARRWQLTNTRYLLGTTNYLDYLNQGFDPGQNRFQIAMRFDIVPKPGVERPTRLEELTAVTRPDGQFALFEFTGALPRAKLYTNWQPGAADTNTLKLLGSPTFDPAQTVVVANPVPPPTANSTNQNAGTVEYASYAPKSIELQAKAVAPSILLLNDRFDPNWKVSVDGKPETLLRCNYIMRGVAVPAGEHRIKFEFVQPVGALYVSLATMGFAVALVGFLAVFKPREKSAPGTLPSQAKGRTAAVGK